jgi:hypothetical protein
MIIAAGVMVGDILLSIYKTKKSRPAKKPPAYAFWSALTTNMRNI